MGRRYSQYLKCQKEGHAPTSLYNTKDHVCRFCGTKYRAIISGYIEDNVPGEDE